MVDVTHQDGNKRNADGSINKTFTDVNMSGHNQNIIVSSVNPTLMSTNQKNINHLQQQPLQQQHQHFNVVHHQNNLQTKQQPQQFSLVHHQNLQKPILINASSGSGSVLQQTNAGSNKIILTPASQSISGNVYVGTHGKLVIPSNNNNQSIVLDSSKVTSSNNMQQQKNQTAHQQRVKIDNKVNMLIDSSESKNIIYKLNKNSNKLIHTVANLIPVHATAKNCNIQQITKQISSNPTIINASNRRTQQQLRQQQQINIGSTITTSNFLNTATTSKIQQPNNGNDSNPR